MKIVVDVNVVLSSLIGKGDSFDVFANNFLLNKFEFIAPEFLLSELEKHKGEFFKRSKLSREIFDSTLKLILRQITFIPKSEFLEDITKAEKILSEHLKDAPYLALSLRIGACPIFSGDKVLKRLLSKTSVKVLSPKEMLDKF